jgi:hypothetical protein
VQSFEANKNSAFYAPMQTRREGVGGSFPGPREIRGAQARRERGVGVSKTTSSLRRVSRERRDEFLEAGASL